MIPSSEVFRRLDAARQVAAVAAAYLAEVCDRPRQPELKGRYDLHLDADAEAGRRIAAGLGAAFPGEFVLEEDGPEDPGTGDWLWIVDPLDGTVNYFHGLPWYCVSVACYHRPGARAGHPLWGFGSPVASVVAAPALGLEFTASAGGGAFVNGRRLQAGLEGLDRGLLSCSRGSRDEDQHWVRRFLEAVGPRARKTRNQGAAALDLAYVAKGSLAAHVQRSLRPWDVAAGAHLVTEAGGVFEAWAGEGGALHVAAGGPTAYQELKESLPCDS